MPRDTEYDRLREEMNGAWEAKEYAKKQHDDSWEDVQRLQDRHGSRINQLIREHDDTFEDMKRAYADASNAFESGDHGDAASSSARGRELRDRLPSLVSERRALVDELKRAQALHRTVLDVYKTKKTEFLLAKERFDDRKAKRQNERDDILSRAGIQHYGYEVLVKLAADGKTHIYFGGVGQPDGDGHAHYVLDSAGNIEYRRDPFAERGPQNFR